MYELRPLPTLAPDALNGSEMLYQLIDMLDLLVITLKSVPIIPNTRGLFDPVTHEWLTPLVSVFDVLTALVLIAVTIFVYLRLSSIGSNAVGNLLSKTGINK